MGAWDVVDIEDVMNVIRSAWAFKLKVYPDVIIKRSKDILCTCGDMQVKVIDLFETYATFVQWNTVHIMIILEVILQLK